MLLKRKQILSEVDKKLAEILEKLNAEEIAFHKKLDELEPIEAQLKVVNDIYIIFKSCLVQHVFDASTIYHT